MSAIEIGRVVKPHGLRGEVKVRLHWSDSAALTEAEHVFVRQGDGADRSIRVQSARGGPQGVLLKLEGYDDVDAAELLRGAVLLVPRESLPPLEPGEYYLCDLIGAEVIGPEGTVGEVVEVRTHPTVDAVVVRLGDGTLAEQPLVEPWVSEVDTNNKRLVLANLDGLV